MIAQARDWAAETILDSRMTDTNGLILLLRREPSEYDNRPAFGVRCERGPVLNGLWWQREDHARAAFAAAVAARRCSTLTTVACHIRPSGEAPDV